MKFLDQVKAYAKGILRVVAIRIIPITIGITLLVAASFLITGNFTAPALSERLVWSGLGIALVSGFLVFGSTVGGRDYGLSGAFIRSAHVNDLIEFNIEVRKQVESKFDFRIQIFVVGWCVFGLGVLAQSLFA